MWDTFCRNILSVSNIDLSDLFVKPVTGHPDVFAFQFDFIPQGKALEDGAPAPVVTELEDGDLLIEGMAAVFEGMDREDENFAPGAFRAGIKSFLEGQSALCWHHKHDQVLGRVLDLQEKPDGLWLKARVDGAVAKHPTLGTVYEQIKRGTINALSCGGFFKRGQGVTANKITGVDLTEVSCTAVPVHPGTRFSVVAGKALLDDVKVPEKPSVGDVREEDVQQIQFITDELARIFEMLEAAAAKRKSNSVTVTT